MTSPLKFKGQATAYKFDLANLPSKWSLTIALGLPNLFLGLVFSIMLISFMSAGVAQAGPIDLTPHGVPTPRPSSTRAMAEVEVAHPDGAKPIANTGEPIVFPDFAKVNGGPNAAGQSASGQSAAKSTPKTCRRDGHVYQTDDVMFASCTAQNEVERALPRKNHGKSNGASTGLD